MGYTHEKRFAIPLSNIINDYYYEVIKDLGKGKYKAIKKGFDISIKPTEINISEKPNQHKFCWVDEDFINQKIAELEMIELSYISDLINNNHISYIQFLGSKKVACVYFTNNDYYPQSINLVTNGIYLKLINLMKEKFNCKVAGSPEPKLYYNNNNTPYIVKEILEEYPTSWECTLRDISDYDPFYIL